MFLFAPPIFDTFSRRPEALITRGLYSPQARVTYLGGRRPPPLCCRITSNGSALAHNWVLRHSRKEKNTGRPKAVGVATTQKSHRHLKFSCRGYDAARAGRRPGQHRIPYKRILDRDLIFALFATQKGARKIQGAKKGPEIAEVHHRNSH